MEWGQLLPLDVHRGFIPSTQFTIQTHGSFNFQSAFRVMGREPHYNIEEITIILDYIDRKPETYFLILVKKKSNSVFLMNI